MNAPLKHMAKDIDVRWGSRVAAICDDAGCWALTIDEKQAVNEEKAMYDRVIIAAPAEQAAQLLGGMGHKFAATARASVSRPCWSAMVSFAAPLSLTQDAIRFADGAVSWAARNSAKPGRDGPESWVIHASPAYSTELLDHSQDDAARQLLAQFFSQTGIAPTKPAYLAGHRWLYAMAEPVGAQICLWDADRQVGVCGDWLVQPRVEGAWQSGRAMADAILAATL